VYENQKAFSMTKVIVLSKMITLALFARFSNILITSNHTFLTSEALEGIAATIPKNIAERQKEIK